MKIVKLGLVFLAAIVLAGLGAIAMVFAQTPAPSVSFSDSAATYLCSNNGAVLRYVLEWGGGIIGGASILGNFRSKLPPWAVAILDGLTGDIASALKAKAAAAQPPVAKS